MEAGSGCRVAKDQGSAVLSGQLERCTPLIPHPPRNHRPLCRFSILPPRQLLIHSLSIIYVSIYIYMNSFIHPTPLYLLIKSIYPSMHSSSPTL